MAQTLDMDTFPEAGELTERLNRDHTAELDEQLNLFADSRQKPTAFLQLADTQEFLIQRLKNTYCEMIRAARTLESQLLTERQKWNVVSRRYEWVGQDGNKLSDEAAKEAKARVREYQDAVDIERVFNMKSSTRAALNKALKSDDVPHRVVNRMLLVLKHDFSDFGACTMFEGATPVKQAINGWSKCMRACDDMIDILWDKSLTLSIQHPSKRRRTE
eukprot:COSAG06_NODE_7131_length_2619_cov_2.425397_2_plen_217_part_00